MKEYTREELIAICEKAIVPQSEWSDRDSFDSIKGVGIAYALLKAGCKFQVLYEEPLITDESTIWIKFWVKNFSWFEMANEEDCPDGYCSDSDGSELTIYLPTEKRLEQTKGKDWY